MPENVCVRGQRLLQSQCGLGNPTVSRSPVTAAGNGASIPGVIVRRRRVLGWRVEQFWEIDMRDLGLAAGALSDAGFGFDIGNDVDAFARGPLVEVSSDCLADTAEHARSVECRRALLVLQTDTHVSATLRFVSAVPAR